MGVQNADSAATRASNSRREAHIVAYKGRLYVGTTHRRLDGLGIIDPPVALAGDVAAAELGAAVRRAMNASQIIPNFDLSELRQRTTQLVRAYGAKSTKALYRECAACYIEVRDGTLVVMPQAYDGDRMLVELEESVKSFDGDPDDTQVGTAVRTALDVSSRQRG